MHQVHARSDVGWPITVLEQWRKQPDIARVDGQELLENGSFRIVVLYFPQLSDADAFRQALAAAAGQITGNPVFQTVTRI